MQYTEATGYLNSLKGSGIRLRLDHTRELLRLLGSPHKGLKVIHVAGTNGKGSVCAMVYSILREAGFSVGLYTSPHLNSFTERVVVDGIQIPEKHLARLVSEIKPYVFDVSSRLGEPTFFEVTTALALKYFSESNPDYVVLEVGLGGRLDATNVVDSLVSVITNVTLEHTQILGSSIKEIASEKAGIIKEESIMVTASSGEALDVIEKACDMRKTKLIHVGSDVEYKKIKSTTKEQTFDVYGRYDNYKNLSIKLLGEHQITNAATAIAAVESLRKYSTIISKEKIKEGLRGVRWPGRMEVMQEKPLVILDGAHNPDGITKLKETLKLFDRKKLFLVFGVSANKDYTNMIKTLSQTADHIILTESKLTTVVPANELLVEAKKYIKNTIVIRDVVSAVDHALDDAREHDLVCVTGSIFVVAEARRIWEKEVTI